MGASVLILRATQEISMVEALAEEQVPSQSQILKSIGLFFLFAKLIVLYL